MSQKSWIPDRLKAAVQAAEAAGWTYDRTAKNHPRLRPPEGMRDSLGNPQAPIIFGSTPSDHRGDKNGFAALRRRGVTW